jgi:hypothetical protein
MRSPPTGPISPLSAGIQLVTHGVEAVSPSLATITLAIMVRAAVDAIPHHPDASADEQAAQCQTAFDMIAALRPRDVLEAMLAARFVAFHFQIMDDVRCAAQRDLPAVLKLRYRANAIA